MFGFGRKKSLDRFARRGPILVTHEEAKAALARSMGESSGPTVEWGGLDLPLEAARAHFMVVGTTGSGKSLTLRLLMRTVLPRIRPGSSWRALVYDPKNQAFSDIHAAGADMSRVVTLNPFDGRGAPWDIGRDIQSPGHAFELSRLLFPTVKRADPFWDDAAADLLLGTILSFIAKRGQSWTLRDVLLAVSHTEDLKAVLGWDEDANAQRLARYFNSGRLSQTILTTLTVKASLFGIVAACWHNARRPAVSLEEWVKGESIVILGHSEDYAAALQPINQVIFRRVAELLLREPDSDTRKSWIFLDELGATGRLDHLDALMLKGRSRGVSLVLAFQSYSSLVGTYGPEAAEALTEQPGNKAFLKLRGSTTARWAEGLFGAEEYIETMRNLSIGEQGYSVSMNKGRVVRAVVRSDELLALDLPNKQAGRGIEGFFLVDGAGAFRHTVSSRHIADRLAGGGAGRAPADVEGRDPMEQRLSRWTPEEREELGLARTQTPPTKPHGGESEVRARDEDARLGPLPLLGEDD